MFTYLLFSAVLLSMCRSLGTVRTGTEMAVLDSPSVIVRTVSVMWTKSNIELELLLTEFRSCVSRGGRPGLPVRNSPYSLCGRKVTLNSNCC